jgi:hypothetical protein
MFATILLDLRNCFLVNGLRGENTYEGVALGKKKKFFGVYFGIVWG